MGISRRSTSVRVAAWVCLWVVTVGCGCYAIFDLYSILFSRGTGVGTLALAFATLAAIALWFLSDSRIARLTCVIALLAFVCALVPAARQLHAAGAVALMALVPTLMTWRAWWTREQR